MVRVVTDEEEEEAVFTDREAGPAVMGVGQGCAHAGASRPVG